MQRYFLCYFKIKKIIYSLCVIIVTILVSFGVNKIDKQKAINQAKNNYNDNQKQCIVVGDTQFYVFVSKYGKGIRINNK